ncbi:hypothetical protein J3Q64DRAFT_1766115 [Phycomyces blakesleeanus]
MRYSDSHQASLRLLLLGSVLLTAYCAAAVQTTELVGPLSQSTGIMCIQRVCPTLDTGVDGSEECPTECSDSCYRDDDPCCPGNYVMTCDSSSSSSSGSSSGKTSSTPAHPSSIGVPTGLSSGAPSSSAAITGASLSHSSAALSSSAPSPSGAKPSSIQSASSSSSGANAGSSDTSAANLVTIKPFVVLSLSLILSMKLIL